jgi:predicted O-methyltransferase YrrM
MVARSRRMEVLPTTGLLARMRMAVRAIVPPQWRPSAYLTNLTRAQTNSIVRAGPFAGMKYGAVAVGSVYIAKLLGTYERELAGAIERIIASMPVKIVVVGAAEGYYAVGLARRCPEAEIVAFESDAAGRTALAETARLNGVVRQVAIHEKCEPADLAESLTDPSRTVIVCDVEGYEDVLLDPVELPGLAQASLLVELHDFLIPGIAERLRDRFRKTHRIEEIYELDRASSEFPYTTPYTRLMPQRYVLWAVRDHRPFRMSWLWMESKV